MSYQTTGAMPQALKNWHTALEARDPAVLQGLFTEDCVFWSPVVHKAQEGEAKTIMYLTGAFYSLVPNGFHYVREVWDDHHGILEFKATIDGIDINGADMIAWNEDGLITEFKVMVRPMQGMMKLKEKMAEMLENFS